MPKYGKLINGELQTSNHMLQDYKPITYEQIPDFDQQTHAVYQLGPVDRGEDIYIGIRVEELELEDFDDAFEF